MIQSSILAHVRFSKISFSVFPTSGKIENKNQENVKTIIQRIKKSKSNFY